MRAHPGGETSLIVGRTCRSRYAGLGGYLIQRKRPRITPAVEMPLGVCGNGAKLRLFAAGSDDELIVEEERRIAFAANDEEERR